MECSIVTRFCGEHEWVLCTRIALQTHVGHGKINKCDCRHNVKLPPIFPKFILYVVLKKYKFDTNSNEHQLSYYNCALSACQYYFSCVSKVTVNDPSYIPHIMGVDSGRMA